MTTLDRVLEAVRTEIIDHGVDYVRRDRVALAVGVSWTHVSRLASDMQEAAPVDVAPGVPRLVWEAISRAVAGADLPVLARAVQAGHPLMTDREVLAAQAAAAFPDLTDPVNARPVFRIAYNMVRAEGFAAVNRDKIAAECGVCPASVGNAFGDMGKMVDTLLQWGIERGDEVMTARGLQIAHPLALAAPEPLRVAAALKLAGGL